MTAQRLPVLSHQDDAEAFGDAMDMAEVSAPDVADSAQRIFDLLDAAAACTFARGRVDVFADTGGVAEMAFRDWAVLRGVELIERVYPSQTIGYQHRSLSLRRDQWSDLACLMWNAKRAEAYDIDKCTKCRTVAMQALNGAGMCAACAYSATGHTPWSPAQERQ